MIAIARWFQSTSLATARFPLHNCPMLYKILIPIFYVVNVVLGATQCPRITQRKEVTDMTVADWEIYTTTLAASVNHIDTKTGLSLWESFAHLHESVADAIHGNCLFFEWHRYFLKYVESRLQEINPSFSFFYFDHSRVYDQLGSSLIWKYLGKHHRSVPLNNGVFANETFEIVESMLVRDSDYPGFNGNSVDSVEFWSRLLETSITNRDPLSWRLDTETAHGNFHCIVGGIFCTMKSPLDPLFFAHHAFIDYLWMQAQIRWQLEGIDPKAQFWGECTIDTPLPYFTDMKLGQVMDSSDVCVQYLQFQSKSSLSKRSSSFTDWIDPQVAKLAELLPEGYLPRNYKRTQKSPKPLPKHWLEMNFKNIDIQPSLDRIHHLYRVIIDEVAQGIEMHVMPFMEDTPETRPYVGLIRNALGVLEDLDEEKVADFFSRVNLF